MGKQLTEKQQAFINYAKQIHNVLNEMVEIYHDLSEEEISVIDEFFPQNLKSMDEQACDFFTFAEEIEEKFKS